MVDEERDTASKAHMRVNHVEGNVKEIKEDVKENTGFIRENTKLIHNLTADVASLKTEIRIIGGIFLAVVISLLVAYLSS